jgi:hypothetical protein
MRNKHGFWEKIGCPTWRSFVRGTTCCAITWSSEATEIEYMTPDKRGSLTASDVPDIELPPGAPLDEVARIVLDIFAKHPGEPPPAKPARREPAVHRSGGPSR